MKQFERTKATWERVMFAPLAQFNSGESCVTRDPYNMYVDLFAQNARLPHMKPVTMSNDAFSAQIISVLADCDVPRVVIPTEPCNIIVDRPTFLERINMIARLGDEPDMALRQTFDEASRENHYIIAGGLISKLLDPCTDMSRDIKNSDVDIFVFGSDHATRIKTIRMLLERFDIESATYYMCFPSVITIYRVDAIPVQIICVDRDAPVEIIANFDMSISCAWWEDQRAFALVPFVESMITRQIYNATEFDAHRATMSRLITKGFVRGFNLPPVTTQRYARRDARQLSVVMERAITSYFHNPSRITSAMSRAQINDLLVGHPSYAVSHSRQISESPRNISSMWMRPLSRDTMYYYGVNQMPMGQLTLNHPDPIFSVIKTEDLAHENITMTYGTLANGKVVVYIENTDSFYCLCRATSHSTAICFPQRYGSGYFTGTDHLSKHMPWKYISSIAQFAESFGKDPNYRAIITIVPNNVRHAVRTMIVFIAHDN